MAGERIEALLFDKDGTLFDFQATWASVTEAILDRLAPSPALRAALAEAGGFDPATRRFRAGSTIVAGSADDTARAWAPLLGHPEPEIARLIDDIAAEMTGPDTLVPAVPDLPGFLQGLRRGGLRLGVATHDSEANARAHLAAVGALTAFDFVAGYDSGFGLKPGPGMLVAFAARTGVSPGAVAMVGDSVHDLGVAHAAGGAAAIAVLTGPATAEDLAPHADHVLSSIAGLPGLLGLPTSPA